MTGIEYAKDDWYPVAMVGEVPNGSEKETQLLGTRITIIADERNGIQVSERGYKLKTQVAFDHIWTTLSDNPRTLFAIPEASEVERRFVPCGVVRVKCSPLIAVENFLDIAHFPFVHTVPAPMTAVLYKTCPPKPEFQDVIAIFVQPIDEETCDVWPWMALYDDESTMAELIQFQQLIFLQDRSILENQLPRKLPLDPGMELPTRADLTSIAYRRWLRKRGASYGATHSAS